MDIKRLPDRPAPPSRPIKSFDAPAPSPPPAKHGPIPTANATAAQAVRIATNPSGIDPTQQRF